MDGKSVRSAVASAAFVVCAAFGFTAVADSPSVFYVAPDGTGTGTSWEDAAPIGTAFAAAVEAGGGEIWIKEGTYRLSGSESLMVCSNLVVRGGFVGDETSADAADPKAHPTILSGEGLDCGWTMNGTVLKTNDANFVPLWKDGEFIVARADDVGANYRNPCTSNIGSGLKASFIKSSVPVTGLKIIGLTFTANTSKTAVVLPGDSEVEIDSCRFLACGCHSGGLVNGVLNIAGTLTMRKSDVIGCPCPVLLSGTNTVAVNRFIGCRFEDCTGAASALASGAIMSTGAQPLEITGCTFLRNTGISQGNGGSILPAAVISSKANKLTITDCVFEGNRVRNTGSIPYACISASSQTVISRCLFKDNNLRSTTKPNFTLGTYSACIYKSGSPLTVRDTVFIGNNCYVETGLSKELSWASAVTVNSSVAQFYNCSFYGGRSEVVATDDAVKGNHSCETVRLARSGSRNDDGKGVAFVNCLFSDNELDGNVDNQAEVVLDNKTDTWFSFALVNTVIWNGQSGYRALFANSAYPVCITHSNIIGYEGEAYTNGSSYVEYATAVDPTVAEKPVKARGTYPFRGMLGLSSSSAFARSGVPIYESDGDLYFYAPGMVSGKPWRKCALKSSNVAELDAGDPLPDAFGGARAEGQICYGPALTDPPGFMLMLK